MPGALLFVPWHLGKSRTLPGNKDQGGGRHQADRAVEPGKFDFQGIQGGLVGMADADGSAVFAGPLDQFAELVILGTPLTY